MLKEHDSPHVPRVVPQEALVLSDHSHKEALVATEDPTSSTSCIASKPSLPVLFEAATMTTTWVSTVEDLRASSLPRPVKVPPVRQIITIAVATWTSELKEVPITPLRPPRLSLIS